MEELCTGCLCAGRKLVLLHETEYYNIYSQILNEIPVVDLSRVVVQICWECRATLRRIQEFKDMVKRSYLDLIQCVASPRVPRLSCHTQHLSPRVKLELSVELHVKSHEPESEPDADAVAADVSGTTFADRLVFEHCDDNEPEPEERKKTVKFKKSEKKLKKKKKKRKKVNKKMDLDEEVAPDEDIHPDEEIHPDDVEENKPIPEVAVEDSGDHVTPVVEPNFRQPLKWSVGIESATEKPKCEECGKVFSSKKTYRYHINVLHKGNNQYPCPRCGKVYQWKSNLGRHMRTHKAVDAGELYCSLCDKTFASVATYRQHLKISRRHVSENDYSFVCNECGKKFVNKTRLRDHIDWEHLKKIKFRCLLCNKPFKCHTSLYVHTQNVHRDKEKKDNLCHVCGKSYQNAAKLKYHITAMHSGSSPYRCGECGAAFGWYSSLYRHLRELHYKMKVQPKKAKKSKKVPDLLFQPGLPAQYPMQPPG